MWETHSLTFTNRYWSLALFCNGHEADSNIQEHPGHLWTHIYTQTHAPREQFIEYMKMLCLSQTPLCKATYLFWAMRVKDLPQGPSQAVVADTGLNWHSLDYYPWETGDPMRNPTQTTERTPDLGRDPMTTLLWSTRLISKLLQDYFCPLRKEWCSCGWGSRWVRSDRGVNPLQPRKIESNPSYTHTSTFLDLPSAAALSSLAATCHLSI